MEEPRYLVAEAVSANCAACLGCLVCGTCGACGACALADFAAAIIALDAPIGIIVANNFG